MNYACALAALACALAGCRRDKIPPSMPVQAPPALIQVSGAGTSFVAKDGSGEHPWAAWGFNYDHDDSPDERLIEDYWDAEWPRVVRDFRAMRGMGANVVRVHLQLPRFMRSPTEANAASLEKLAQLLDLASREGLHVDLTGLANYRPASLPPWYAALSEADRWATQARFWDAVAARGARSDAVFCYDVMNEPAIAGDGETRWQPAPWINGRTYIEYIAKDLAGRTPAEVGRTWLRSMVAAIRGHDARHLVTVGAFTVLDQTRVLPFGLTPREAAAEVDFLSVHLYPKTGALEVTRRELRDLAVGKPIVVEEVAPLDCTSDEVKAIVDEHRGGVAGWMSFYFGRSIEQYRASPKAEDQAMAAWLTAFVQWAPR